MPALKPFRAWRYAADLSVVTAPPYDVLSSTDAASYRALSPQNIVHIDLPDPTPDGYIAAATTLRAWMDDGVLIRDTAPSLTLYRLIFADAKGTSRQITGVIGALLVTDYDAGPVLPHEHVTAKASTDRLDLTRATQANLSPIWGLSLARGLATEVGGVWDAATASGSVPRELLADGVTHQVLPIDDQTMISAINSLLAPADVLIADGHHRYGVAQRYRDEVQACTDAPAAFTMAFINELVDEQLSVEAIHRVYDGVPFDTLHAALAVDFDLAPAPMPSPALLAQMTDLKRLVLLSPDGQATWLTPRPGAFDGLRGLDGLWLEHTLAGIPGLSVTYQHALDDVISEMPHHSGAVLIRPTSIDEIRRTATEGLLMPPKSTFFTPKLRTGLVVRTLDE